MKMKRLSAVLFCLCMILCGCTRTIQSERDEIRQYDWVGEFDNGNRAELTFCDSNAAFSVSDSSEESLDIVGLCSLTDDSIVIIDDCDDVSYEFGYTLHGDSVELCYHGDSVTLMKKVEN